MKLFQLQKLYNVSLRDADIILVVIEKLNRISWRSAY
jgi:hypothetical protein